MSIFHACARLLALLFCLVEASTAVAQPAPQTGVWVARQFKFHDGSTLPEVKLAYTTLGDPKNPAIVVLHGTNGSGTAMLNKDFAGPLFGPGQPFDANKYFIVLPDALGAGRSSKPSDGLAANFPVYNYRDMVQAFHLLLTQGLGLNHVRLVIGNSMGGMHTWMMGIMYPDYADVLIPMASMPIAMSGRNWMTRRLIIDSIRNDPGYEGGVYKTQPKAAQYAHTMYAIATNGGANPFPTTPTTRCISGTLPGISPLNLIWKKSGPPC